jgi:predicted CxxxxCH...CXXCH cytochrome family protein
VSLVGTRSIVLTATLTAAGGCEWPRETSARDGVHPVGWAEAAGGASHATWLENQGYPLAECRACHGEDYAGGPVGAPCSSRGCHEGGVERCSTCHGAADEPRPATGAHAAHTTCATCHRLPAALEAPGHLNGQVDVLFSGLALAGGATPDWDADARRCVGTYCHGQANPWWDDREPPGCAGCHGAPPVSHVRFARVADAPDECAACHGSPPEGSHVDGVLGLAEIACDACHGRTGSPAPPLGLDGAMSATDPAVGAHRAHLEASLVDRIGKPVACRTCHPIPASTSAAGHLDTTAPADVALALGGAYDPIAGTCQVWCHFDRVPGPVWADASGNERACDACHGFPPAQTRAGALHPPGAGDLLLCVGCHLFDSARHVDGVVDFP